MQVRNIPLTEITPNAHNPRKFINQDELQELADNIKELGLLQPITIRKMPKGSATKYEIICGERRYRASILAGLEDIPAIVKDMDDKEAFMAMIVENLQRKDIDPMEEAVAINELYTSGGVKVGEIAKMLGKSSSFVIGRIQLVNILPEFIQLMREGTLYLIHLQSICKLTKEQQKTLFEECFSPESIARWTQKILPMDALFSMIDEHVMCSLSKARFSVSDETFSCGKACVGCPLNTANNPDSFKDADNPRCMKRECFVAKQMEYVFREAKQSGFEVIYDGANNDEIIEKAKAFGLTPVSVGKRKYVFEPVMPDESHFKDKECYQKRLATYRHVKAIFDDNVSDGTVAPVYEICYSGILSGERKYIFNVPDDGKTDVNEETKRLERISSIKDKMYGLDESRRESAVEEYRKHMEETNAYSENNEYLKTMESAVFLALILKRLPYGFKQSLGIEWTGDVNDFRTYMETITGNSARIKREFIRMMLADKSVNFSKDLGEILRIFMDAIYDKKQSEIDSALDKKFGKTREGYENLLKELKEPKAENEE